MSRQYKFQTSLGMVFISFDPDQIKQRGVPDCIILQGREYLEKLYTVDHDPLCYYIEIAHDGSLWFKIGFDDDLNNPEYLLEENVREV